MLRFVAGPPRAEGNADQVPHRRSSLALEPPVAAVQSVAVGVVATLDFGAKPSFHGVSSALRSVALPALGFS